MAAFPCFAFLQPFSRAKLLLGAFALLVSNAAAGLAGRLAGSLAFAAAAVLGAFTQVTGFQSLDVLHISDLQRFY